MPIRRASSLTLPERAMVPSAWEMTAESSPASSRAASRYAAAVLVIVPPLLGDPARLLDVAVLTGLVATTQQHDQPLSLLQVIDPVARAIVDPQLRDPATYRLHIAGVARSKAIDPHQDSCSDPPILQFAQPTVEGRTLNDLDHVLTVVHSLGRCQVRQRGQPSTTGYRREVGGMRQCLFGSRRRVAPGRPHRLGSGRPREASARPRPPLLDLH